MTHKRVNEVRVGLFVFVAGIALLATVFFLGSQSNLFLPKYTLYCQFPSINGLRAGALVQLAGLNVGLVDDIAFASSLEQREVMVKLRINRFYRDRIRADSTAAISTQGLLGDKYISVSVGSAEQPALEDGAMITIGESGSLQSVVEKASSVGDEVKRAFASAARVLESIDQGEGMLGGMVRDQSGRKALSDLAAAMADLREIVASVKAGEGTVGRLIRDPTLYDDVRTLLGQANRSKLLKTVVRSTMEENERQGVK
ncbi:MAG: MCE family protein [Deltaproteobacteria bacterium]|nr:MCE family protein [Deltaproteobacteria bacterium]